MPLPHPPPLPILQEIIEQKGSFIPRADSRTHDLESTL